MIHFFELYLFILNNNFQSGKGLSALEASNSANVKEDIHKIFLPSETTEEKANGNKARPKIIILLFHQREIDFDKICMIMIQTIRT